MCFTWHAPGTWEPITRHMSELLKEHEGIDIPRSTLRRLLVGAGENSPRGRRPPSIEVDARECRVRVC